MVKRMSSHSRQLINLIKKQPTPFFPALFFAFSGFLFFTIPGGSFDCCFFSRVHATLQPALSVGRSVGRLVGRSHLTSFYDFISLTLLLLPKWSGNLKYNPCPPASDFGSRVSGLVKNIPSKNFPKY